MKKILLALGLAGLAAAPAFSQKIAVVDVEAIRLKYAKSVASSKRVQDRIADANKFVADKEAALVKLREEAQSAEKDSKNPTLNDAARAQKQGELQVKAQAFFKARDELNAQKEQITANIRETEMKLTKEVIDDLREKAAVVAKEKGIDLVIPSGSAFYSASSLDVTQDVLKKLNEAYADNPVTPSAPVTEAPKAPAAGK